MIDNQQQLRIFSRIFIPSRKQHVSSRVRELGWRRKFRKLDRAVTAWLQKTKRTREHLRYHAIRLAPLSLSRGRRRRALMFAMRNSWDD